MGQTEEEEEEKKGKVSENVDQGEELVKYIEELIGMMNTGDEEVN
jgi:hypothetical protein